MEFLILGFLIFLIIAIYLFIYFIRKSRILNSYNNNETYDEENGEILKNTYSFGMSNIKFSNYSSGFYKTKFLTRRRTCSNVPSIYEEPPNHLTSYEKPDLHIHIPSAYPSTISENEIFSPSTPLYLPRPGDVSIHKSPPNINNIINNTILIDKNQQKPVINDITEETNQKDKQIPIPNDPLSYIEPTQKAPPIFLMHQSSYDETMMKTNINNNIKKTNYSPFNKNKNDIDFPDRLQLEVAKKAQIPLFIKDPIYTRTISPIPFDPNINKTNLSNDNIKNSFYCNSDKINIVDFKDIIIGETIGKGAFGEVYKSLWNGKTVAMKVLVTQLLNDDILKEFESEIRIMQSLCHRNICQLLGANMNPPNRCLIVEYCINGSLWNALRRPVNIDIACSLRFISDITNGMCYLHSFQPPILHRDLKSPNLLVDNNYTIKIADFGLARVKAYFETMTGNCGTTQWMAPEILAAKSYTEKADIFSFGIVIWEIVSHACPYDGLTQIQAAIGVLNYNLRPTIPSNCFPLFSRLMTSCWDSEPEKRPSFSEISEILRIEGGMI